MIVSVAVLEASGGGGGDDGGDVRFMVRMKIWGAVLKKSK